MPEKTLTEAAYEFMEGLESRKKRMIAVIILCFVLGPVGLGFDWNVVDASERRFSRFSHESFNLDHSHRIYYYHNIRNK